MVRCLARHNEVSWDLRAYQFQCLCEKPDQRRITGHVALGIAGECYLGQVVKDREKTAGPCLPRSDYPPSNKVAPKTRCCRPVSRLTLALIKDPKIQGAHWISANAASLMSNSRGNQRRAAPVLYSGIGCMIARRTRGRTSSMLPLQPKPRIGLGHIRDVKPLLRRNNFCCREDCAVCR